MDQATLSARSRQLGSVLEPVIGQVYFSPECHANYAALGFDPSANQAGGVALPDGPAYFTSRGSVMGQVPGEVVAAAFAVFNPEIVEPHRCGHHLCCARRRGNRPVAPHPRRRTCRPRPGERVAGSGGGDAASRGSAAVRRPA
jgi:hypothetical protein